MGCVWVPPLAAHGGWDRWPEVPDVGAGVAVATGLGLVARTPP